MARRRRNAGSRSATHVEAQAVGFFSAKAATPNGGPNVPMLLVTLSRKPGILEHLAFSQEDAIRLIGALAHGLANQDLLLGHALLHVTARTQAEGDLCERPAHAAVAAEEKRTLVVGHPPPNAHTNLSPPTRSPQILEESVRFETRFARQ